MILIVIRGMDITLSEILTGDNDLGGLQTLFVF